MKLYHHPYSTYARRVHMALLEKDIDAEYVYVDMGKGAHREPDFLKMNPYHRVPVLDDDGFILHESAAILDYLEAAHPQPALAPSDVRERARMRMHMLLCDLEFAGPAGTIIFPKRFLPEDRWPKEAMASAAKQIKRHLGILEAHLAGRSYMVGDAYSLADLVYIPFAHFLPLMEIEAPAAVGAWIERISARPAAQQTKPSR